MEEGRCVLCPQGTGSRLFTPADSGGLSFFYRKCRRCGLVFLDPRPDEKEMLAFYPRDYYGEGPRKFRSWLEPPRAFFAWNRVRRVREFLPHMGKALDVGCGQGTFLQFLKREGWECHGTELTPESAVRASRWGIPVSIGEIKKDQFPPRSFDLITFWHVLEHLADPVKTLRGLRGLLKKGGILALSTPNIDSLQAEIGKGRWFHLDPPRHLYLYSPPTLGEMMESLGFRLLRIRHFSMEQNPYGWLQTLLNLSGLPADSLYRLLKNTRDLGQQRLTFSQKAKTLLLAGGLLPHCLLLSAIMAWFHRGGTIEAYFRVEDGRD
jgi:SAM-dependent methyltransferase